MKLMSLMLFCMLSIIAIASTKDDRDAYHRDLKEKATNGDTHAMLMLSTYYFSDEGKDDHEGLAEEYLNKAADLGNAEAQYLLGSRYFYGFGLTKDLAKGIHWIRKAADQGYVEAQQAMGGLYELGDSIDKDYDLAVSWYTKSAEQGHTESQLWLGDHYFYEESNLALALKWYTQAAEQNNTIAAKRLGYMYFTGRGVDADQSLAFKWFKVAAENSSGGACVALSLMYNDGIGVGENPVEAYAWALAVSEPGVANYLLLQDDLKIYSALMHQDLYESVMLQLKEIDASSDTGLFGVKITPGISEQKFKIVIEELRKHLERPLTSEQKNHGIDRAKEIAVRMKT